MSITLIEEINYNSKRTITNQKCKMIISKIFILYLSTKGSSSNYISPHLTIDTLQWPRNLFNVHYTVSERIKLYIIYGVTRDTGMLWYL